MHWIAITVALAIGSGVAAERRHGERAGAAARRLLRLMLYWLVPPIVFFNMTRLELDANVGAGIGLAWISLAVTGVVAFVLATRALGLERWRAGAVINAAIQPNTGYLGLPLCAAVLGLDALDEAIAFDVLVGAPSLLLGVFGVGAAFGRNAGETLRRRVHAFFTRNPPLLAALLGLLAPAWLAPDVVVDASRVLVFAMLPLGFFAVGVTLAEEAEEGKAPFPPPLSRPVAVALGLRLLFAPLLLLALAAPLIDIPDAYLLSAAMATGLNGLIVADAYGLDVGIASGAIAWSTAAVLLVGLVAVTLT